MKIHIVQKGDTLWKIAKKYGVNFEELKKMNAQLSNPDMIMPGMKIKVPTGGGTIKKEAPITGGTPQAKINMGSKKEMPTAKEKPMPIPEVKKEVPKQVPVKEQPKKEMPKPEVPKPVKKEEPVKPYTPKMPKFVLPEIDINNYYMMNMANMQQQVQLPPQPQLPPKPDNIFPEIKPEVKPELKPQVKPEMKPIVKPEVKPLPPKSEIKPSVKSEIKPEIKIEKNDFMEESPSMMPLFQGGYQQPMIPYPYNYYPGAPAMQGPGWGYPGGQQMTPYPQVQGATDFTNQFPGLGVPQADLESSSFDQQMQMPLSPNKEGNLQPQVAPMTDMTGPTLYGTPISPVMPGPGWCPPYGQMPYGYPQQMPYMPQVGGVMGGQMPHQMPQVGGMMDNQMPHQMPQVGGMMDNQMPNQMPQVGGMMDEESSEMPMPQMPQVGGMMDHQMPNQMPQVGGMMDHQMPQVGGMMDYQMPHQMPQVAGMMNHQMPHQMPQIGGMMDHQMHNQMPQVGGMMDHQMHNQMPQVGGMMDHQMHNQMPQLGGMMQGQMPHMPQLGGMMNHQMPHQMPQVGGMMQQPNMPKQAVQGLEKDCGCGDTMGQQMGNPYGSMGPGFHQPHYGYPMGYGQPGLGNPYGPMGPGFHQPQHGYPVGYGQPGLMHPYGAGPGSFGMPRFDEESNEY